MAERVSDAVERGYDRAVELLGADTADELSADALRALEASQTLWESGEMQEMIASGNVSDLPPEVRPGNDE